VFPLLLSLLLDLVIAAPLASRFQFPCVLSLPTCSLLSSLEVNVWMEED
jgi:hypothetical protein